MRVAVFSVLGLECVVVKSLGGYPGFAIGRVVLIEDTGDGALNRTIACIVARAQIERQNIVDSVDNVL